MGQAKQRGTREQRVALAVERQRAPWKQQWDKAERRRQEVKRTGRGSAALNVRAIIDGVLRLARAWR